MMEFTQKLNFVSGSQ